MTDTEAKRPKPAREKPPANVDPETGEIDPAPPKIESGEAAVGPPPSPDSLTPKRPRNTKHNAGPKMQADLADRQVVEAWIAILGDEQAIDAMADDEKAEHRAFLMSVFNHVNAAIDYIDKSHLKAVPS